MRVVGVDWSGRANGAEETIWLAEVRDGQLTELYNGLDRAATIGALLRTVDEDPETVIGLDFAFSFPAWWCVQSGWESPRGVWEAMRSGGEELLAACEPPFWGRAGKRVSVDRDRLFRQTDREPGVGSPKSVFQIGGAGAVGTGSVRGMPHLLELADAGLAIWPFEAASPGGPIVLEIYPRIFTGPVLKGRWRARHQALITTFPDQPRELLERAAGSDDAFDATFSALAMHRYAEELGALEASADPSSAIEGRIWRPAATDRVPKGTSRDNQR